MTEAEWLACADPEPMLEFLRGKATDRKLRLFACTCCRRTWLYRHDEWRRMGAGSHAALESGWAKKEADLAWQAAEAAERYADGFTGFAELQALFASPEVQESADCYAAGADAHWTAKASAYRTRYCANYCSPRSYRLGASYRSASKLDSDLEQAQQCRELRDIFGNPFHHVRIEPGWRIPGVVDLAAGMYERRAFEWLPALADALGRAGCTDPDILGHCRGGGGHVRGCWVVDLVLEKG